MLKKLKCPNIIILFIFRNFSLCTTVKVHKCLTFCLVPKKLKHKKGEIYSDACYLNNYFVTTYKTIKYIQINISVDIKTKEIVRE